MRGATSSPELQARGEGLYPLTVLEETAKQIPHAVSSHWGMEHGLHGVLVVLLREDDCQVCTHHTPENQAPAVRQPPTPLSGGRSTRASVKGKRKRARKHEGHLPGLLARWNALFPWRSHASRRGGHTEAGVAATTSNEIA